MKVVYFATGGAAEVAADLRRLRLAAERDFFRLVVPASLAKAAAPESVPKNLALPPERVLRYRPLLAPLLWLRLIFFVGVSSPARIICLTSRPRFRFLKLLALALRGRVSFSNGQGEPLSFSVWDLLWLSWVWLRKEAAPRGPVCVIGSAPPGTLRQVVHSLRRRYPEESLLGVLPASLPPGAAPLFDCCMQANQSALLPYLRLLPRCVGRNRFSRVILPCTGEGFGKWKCMGWFLPLMHIEIYNENLDAFGGRHVLSLSRHLLWRGRDGLRYANSLVRYLLWRSRERYQTWRVNRILHHHALPVGVIGSASAYYLQRILPRVRACHPGVRIHGLLPPSLEGPAAGLFDSVTILRPGILPLLSCFGHLLLRARRFQRWFVPFTNEPYQKMQWIGFLLPLAAPQIVNEQADSFPARNLRMFYQHFRWRLRDHLSFQIVSGAVGENLLLRALHLLLYGFRLLDGAAILLRVRWHSRLSLEELSGPAAAPKALPLRPSVDLICVADSETSRRASQCLRDAGEKAAVRWIAADSLPQAGAAIRDSRADYIALLDGACRMRTPQWLDRLLETFDERTAQVGPQIVSPDGGTFLRGLLLGNGKGPQWNSNHAVRWHTRQEWLEVDALPETCVLVRRSVFAQTGWPWAAAPDRAWASLDFGRRLAALGWLSICNQGITAEHESAAALERGEHLLAQAGALTGAQNSPEQPSWGQR